jgi:hypothetical protein
VSGALPNFLIIGAAKAGTTSLARWLADHPDVFVPVRKEVHYFDRAVNYDRGEEWYRSQFAGVGTQRAIGEATPSYLAGATTMGRVAALVPQAKLIAILREPVDRAYSHYWYERSLGFEKREFAALDPTEKYFEQSRYVRQFEELVKHYPLDRVLVMRFETLRDQPDVAFAEACRWLDVDDTVSPPSVGQVFNAHYRVRSKRLRRIIRFRLRLFSRAPRLAEAADRLLAPPDRYPALDSAVAARLRRSFAEDNAALGQLLGIDVAGWNA